MAANFVTNSCGLMLILFISKPFKFNSRSPDTRLSKACR